MARIRTIGELTRALQQGSKLIFDMFQKRRSDVSVGYDDAVEVLDGDYGRVDRLIALGIVEREGEQLELGDAYLRFFEEVLEANADINVGTVAEFMNRLHLSIESYLAAETPGRKQQFLRDVRHALRSIARSCERNVSDLRRNIEITYKQEPNFKIKALRLRDFDDKSRQIVRLIEQTEKTVDEQVILLAKADMALRETILEVVNSLKSSAHSLIDISAQIIDFLNRIEYQGAVVRKVRQLKYLRDQHLITEATDIQAVASRMYDVWLEARPRYVTRVSLSFLRDADEALPILENIQRRRECRRTLRSRLAPPLSPDADAVGASTLRTFDHRGLFEGFKAQSSDLFRFLWRYPFSRETGTEERLVLFIQIATQFGGEIRYTGDVGREQNFEYPIILPL